MTWLYYEFDILRQIWRPQAASTPHDRNHLKMAEMDSATQKNPKMIYQMCLCSKNHLQAVLEAAFDHWRPPIKYEGTPKLWIIEKGRGRYLEKIIVGPPPHHQMRQLLCPPF